MFKSWGMTVDQLGRTAAFIPLFFSAWIVKSFGLWTSVVFNHSLGRLIHKFARSVFNKIVSVVWRLSTQSPAPIKTTTTYINTSLGKASL